VSATVTNIDWARAEAQYLNILKNLRSALKGVDAELERLPSMSHAERARLAQRVHFKLGSMGLTANSLREMSAEAAADAALEPGDAPEHVAAPIDRVLQVLAWEESET